MSEEFGKGMNSQSQANVNVDGGMGVRPPADEVKEWVSIQVDQEVGVAGQQLGFDARSSDKIRWAELLQLTEKPEGFRIEDAERWALIRAIKLKQGNLRAAALLLNIGKTTLYRKLHTYGIRKVKP